MNKDWIRRMMNEENRQIRGHLKIRNSLKDIRKYSFIHRTVDIWNGLNEDIATVTSLHKLKEMLDKWKYEGHYKPHLNPA